MVPKMDISHLETKPPFFLNELHLIEFLAKRLHENHQATHAIVKVVNCSPRTYSTAPLLKKTLTSIIEHVVADLVTTKILHLSQCGFMVLEGNLHTTKGQRQTPSQLQTL